MRVLGHPQRRRITNTRTWGNWCIAKAHHFSQEEAKLTWRLICTKCNTRKRSSWQGSFLLGNVDEDRRNLDSSYYFSFLSFSARAWQQLRITLLACDVVAGQASILPWRLREGYTAPCHSLDKRKLRKNGKTSSHCQPLATTPNSDTRKSKFYVSSEARCRGDCPFSTIATSTPTHSWL